MLHMLLFFVWLETPPTKICSQKSSLSLLALVRKLIIIVIENHAFVYFIFSSCLISSDSIKRQIEI